MVTTVRLNFDQSELNQQIKDLVDLLNTQPLDILEPLKQSLFGDADNLIFDIVMSDLIPAASAQRPNEIFVGLKFGSSFEAFIATFRAGELNYTHE